jgi:peptidoglycan/xylan/chitin deacetylase (PgdA/CDA1 family)
MLDFAAFVLLISVLALLTLAIDGAVRRRRPGATRIVAHALVALFVAAFGAWKFTNARSLQVVGEIVPRVDRADAVIALTFDDGPTRAYTGEVLATLARHGVRATFFVNGQDVGRHPESARRIVDAGHELGNHSWSHPIMVGLSLERIRAEIERTDAQIRQAGFDGEIQFRSPYGKKFVALPYVLATMGRRNVFWDVEPDSASSRAGDTDAIVADTFAHVRPGSIVLMHVMTRRRDASRAALPKVIEGLQQRGYQFVTVSELLRRQ